MNSIFSGGFLFSLVDQQNKKIQLARNFGLLTANRAGYSKVNNLNIKYHSDIPKILARVDPLSQKDHVSNVINSILCDFLR